MDLLGLKEIQVRESLGISNEQFGRILTFIDFANVNHWFREDDKDEEGALLPLGTRLTPDLKKLADFLHLFSTDLRFYYGHDAENQRSLAFTMAAKHIIGKNRVFTKPIQKIRHYLDGTELTTNNRTISTDGAGQYIFIPKCNFDVEMSVDAVRLLDTYDTICLLSSDADFVSLIRYLKSKGKKSILIKGGRISGALGGAVDLKINAQDIKRHITAKKQKPGS